MSPPWTRPSVPAAAPSGVHVVRMPPGHRDAVRAPSHDARRAASDTADPEDADSGQRLADRLVEGGYHPVLVLGGRGSGKTALIASIVRALGARVPGSVTIRPAPWADEADTDRALREGVAAFVRGGTPPPTAPGGFAVLPVVVQPARPLPEARLAFIETRGTGPHPAGPAHAPVRDAIAALLVGYPHPMSFLLPVPIAPMTAAAAPTMDSAAAWTRLGDSSDAALVALLDAYRRLRIAKNRDRHLMLATGWDLHAAPGSPHATFEAPRLDDVAAGMRAAAPDAFQSFAALAAELGPRHCQLMQYCAAVVRTGRHVPLAPDLQANVDRYPRVLLSWLYAAAHGGARVDLFPDPAPRRSRWMRGFDERLASLLRIAGV